MTAYQDKVYGCWLGKCLGGAIGMAYEGVPFQPELTEQDIALQDVPNDDLELQLVWLMALKKHGLGLDHRKLGQIWLDHIPHGVDEYSFALRNLNRGKFFHRRHGRSHPVGNLGGGFCRTSRRRRVFCRAGCIR